MLPNYLHVLMSKSVETLSNMVQIHVWRFEQSIEMMVHSCQLYVTFLSRIVPRSLYNLPAPLNVSKTKS